MYDSWTSIQLPEIGYYIYFIHVETEAYDVYKYFQVYKATKKGKAKIHTHTGWFQNLKDESLCYSD